MTVPPLTPPSDRELLMGALLELAAMGRSGANPSVEARARVCRDLLAGAEAVRRFPKLSYGLRPSLAGGLREVVAAAYAGTEPWAGAVASAADARGEPREDAVLALDLLEDAVSSPAGLPDEIAEARGLRAVPGLAAATATATASPPKPSAGPLGVEARRRWQRVDLVTTEEDGPREGVLLGLDIDMGSRDIAGGSIDADFTKAVGTGVQAARSLLATLGIPILQGDETAPGWRIAGVPEAVSIGGPSVALPAALAMLRSASQLEGADLGPIAGVATGDLTYSGDRWEVVPLPAAVVRRKAAIVEAELGRAVPLITNCASGGPLVRCVKDLAQAALAAWGERWTDWASRLGVTPDGWAVANGAEGLEPEVDATRLVECEARDTGRAVAYFSGGLGAGVIGDYQRSGRTTLARHIVRGLLDQRKISDAIWIGASTALPAGTDVLARMEEIAARALRPYGAARVLVVLEDLDPHHFSGERTISLADVLPALATRLGQPLLAIVRYEKASHVRWTADGIESFVAWETAGASFAEALVAANPDRLAMDRAAQNLAVSFAGRDVGVLRKALVAVADGAREKSEVSARLVEPLASLPVTERDALRTLGAVSAVYARLPGDAPELASLRPETFARVGATFGAGGWRIESPWLARRVAVLPPQGGARTKEATPGELAGRLRDTLARRFDDRWPDAAEQALLVGVVRGAARHGDGTLEELMSGVATRLPRWLPRLTAPVLTSLLRVVGSRLPSESLTEAVTQLLELTVRPSVPATVPELAAALDQLWRNRRFLSESDLHELEENLPDVFATTLAGDVEATPEAHLRLLRAVLKLHFPGTRKLVHSNIDEIFRGAERCTVRDYEVARSAIALMFEHRWAWVEEEESKLGIALEDISGGPGSVRLMGDAERAMLPRVPAIELLLERPPSKSPFGVWLGWLALCDTLVHDPDSGSWTRPDWDSLVEGVDQEICTAADHASIPEAVRAINLLRRYNRGICVRLFNRTGLAARLGDRMSSARGFGERSELLEVFRKVYVMGAKDLLSPGGVPNRQLANALAREATVGGSVGDVRGIGSFLKSAAAIDELYGSATNGFARSFVDALGTEYIENVLLNEDRMSLVFHFVGGLASVGSTALEQALRRHAVPRLADTVRRADGSWPIQIALRLAALPNEGPAFLENLATELGIPRAGDRDPPPWMRDRMLAPRQAEAAVWTHRLAAAVEPESVPIARWFAKQLQHPRPPGLQGSDPSDVALLCRLALTALDRAGVDDGRKQVDTWLARTGWSWAEALEAGQDFGALAAGLGALAKVDSVEAERAARALAEAERAPDGVLMLGDGTPLRAAQLLSTMDECSAGSGAELLNRVEERDFRWRLVLEDLLFEQQPVAQANAVRSLAGVGWAPDERRERRLIERWLDIAQVLRSPKAIAELLRAAAALPSAAQVLPELTEAINAGGLARRVREGALQDLEALPDVLSTLRLAGAAHTARRVFEDAQRTGPGPLFSGGRDGARWDRPVPGLGAATLAARMPLAALCSLVEELEVLAPDYDSAELRTRIAARIFDEAKQPVVPAPTELWHQIGQCAASVGALVRAPRERPRHLHRAGPGAMILSCAWLERKDWMLPLLEADLERVMRAPGAGGWGAAIALAAPDVLGAEDRTPLVERALRSAPPWALKTMLVRAQRDDELRRAVLARAHVLSLRLEEFEEDRTRLSVSADAVLRASWGLSDEQTPAHAFGAAPSGGPAA